MGFVMDILALGISTIIILVVMAVLVLAACFMYVCVKSAQHAVRKGKEDRDE